MPAVLVVAALEEVVDEDDEVVVVERAVLPGQSARDADIRAKALVEKVVDAHVSIGSVHGQ